MTRKLNKNILLIVIIAILVSLMQVPSFAAGGSANASVGKTSLNIGETTSLTVSATNGAIFYDITTSNSSVATVSGGSGESIDTGENASSSKSYTITAVGAGTTTIKVKSYTGTAYDESKFSLDRSFTITVTAPQPPQTNPKPNDNPSENPEGGTTNPPAEETSKSSDATLKSITVGDRTYNNPSTDFTVTAASNISQIDINAVTNNSKASVTGTGTKQLTTGTNAFILKVTAENGQTKNYKVIVRKLSEENTTPNVVEENPPAVTNEPEPQDEPQENLRLKYLLVEDVELIPEFNSEVLQYTVFVTGKEKLGIVAAANYEDANIEITGNENLVVGDNEILIKVTRGEEAILYKITATLENEQVVPVAGSVDTNDSQGGMGTWIKEGGWRYIAFAVLAVIVTILGISLWFANTTEKYSTRAKRARSRFSDDEFRF